MQFYLFILVNAVLFIRPAEIIQELEGAPIYEGIILAALAASAPRILRQLQAKNLTASPITVCMLGILFMIVLSDVASGWIGAAVLEGKNFFKIVLYYLLLVSVIDSAQKLRRLLGWILLLILALSTLALLQHHGVIEIASLEAILQSSVDPETGEILTSPRLCGMGIFHDPNDLSVVLVLGMMICLSRFGESGLTRFAWFFALALLGYTLTLTQSRGGFIALVVALGSQLVGRFGQRKALLIGGPALLALLVLFGGRQTSFDMTNKDDTSQHRIRLWREGIVLLWESPLFGIGAGRYEEECGLVAHNSFIHAYTELGVLGGTFFLAAFISPIMTLHQLGGKSREGTSPELSSIRPCVLACAAAMVGGMLSLSRLYSLTPYLVLGIVTVYLRLSRPKDSSVIPRLNRQFVVTWMAFGLLFLVGAKVFVQIFAGTG